MLLIKLGGSVITNKSKYGEDSFRGNVVERIVDVLPKKDMIVVHGAGSFGHILADEYKITEGYDEWKRIGFARIQRDMQSLNLKILDVLLSRNIPAVTMPPHSFITMGEKVNFSIFDTLLDYGFVPLTYGDAVFDREKGVNICSGDFLMLRLAERYRPEKTIFVSDVDGIFTKPPGEEGAELIRVLRRDDSPDTDLKVRDVTGGMELKIEVMRKIAKYSRVHLVNGFHPERIKSIMEGKDFVGTVVE